MKKILDWKFFLRVAIAIMALSVFLSAALAITPLTGKEILANLAEELEGDVSSTEERLILIGLAIQEIKAMDEKRFSSFMEEDHGKFGILLHRTSRGVENNRNISLDWLLSVDEGSITKLNTKKEEVLGTLKQEAQKIKDKHPNIYDRIVSGDSREVSVEDKSDFKTFLKCFQIERVERKKEIEGLRKIIASLAVAFKNKKNELEEKLELANQTIAQLQQFMLFNRTSSELSNLKIRLDQLKQLKQNVLSQAAQFAANPMQQVGFAQQALKIDRDIENVTRAIVVHIQRQKQALYQSAMQAQTDFMALQKQKEEIDEDKKGAREEISAIDQALAQKQSEYMSLFGQNRNLEEFAQSIEKDVYETFHPYRNVQVANEEIQAQYEEMLSQINGGRNEYAGFDDGFNNIQTGTTRVPMAEPFSDGFGG